MAVAGVLVGCAVLATLEMTIGERVRDVDRSLAADAHSFTADHGIVRVGAQITTVFGSTVWLTLMVGLIAFRWVRHRRGRTAALLLVTAIGSAVVCRTIKFVVERERPSLVPALADPHGSSFPSGHAMQSVAIYGVLLAIVAPSFARPLRYAAFVVVPGFVGAIAVSRVMLGVHYVSDITAGVVLGSIWLAVVTRLDRVPQSTGGERPVAPIESESQRFESVAT